MRTWRVASADATRALGAELARELAPDGVLLLIGDLGAGKTVLAQGVGRGLGLGGCEIQSPTFTLLREHVGGAARLLHFDLYRLSPREVESAGFEELLLGPGVKVVEWAERLPFALPGALVLRIRVVGDEAREIEELAASPLARGD
jgi:tRNA threonylcarbamoyladenosine biosynthesis protein TsaE